VASQIHIAELKKKREDDKRRADLALVALKEKENALLNKEAELDNLRRMLAKKATPLRQGLQVFKTYPTAKGTTLISWLASAKIAGLSTRLNTAQIWSSEDCLMLTENPLHQYVNQIHSMWRQFLT
jgi:hypothetical protein